MSDSHPAPQNNGPQPDDMIRLKVLLIASQRDDLALAALRSILAQLGVPYDTLITTEERLTEQKLATGSNAHYQGILLATSNLSQWQEERQAWAPTLSEADWQMLWAYEARFGIRQVAMYTQPGGAPDDYGLRLVGSVDTMQTPLLLMLTETGRQLFWYLNHANPVSVQMAWVYLNEVRDAATVPLLLTADGQIAAAIRRYTDGREHLALSIAHNPHLVHTWLLGYGLVNWVTRGLFLGQRHAYLSPQIDDILNRNHLWNPETAEQESGPLYRPGATDVAALVSWLARLQQTTRNGDQIKLEMAFNGASALPQDALTEQLLAQQAKFYWINHGYTHLLLNEATYAEGLAEIQRNDAMAQDWGLPHYHADSMVTADVSGLENPEFLRAAKDAGIHYLVSDASRCTWGNPTPNTGIVSSRQPEILIVPRHANNLFYDVSTPDEWVSKYNHIYRSYWGRDSSFAEILDREAEMILRYLLRWDIDPLMFHQPNLHAYDGAHSLFADLIDCVLDKYNRLLGDTPIQSLSQHAIGEAMAWRAAYDQAVIQAVLIRGKGIILLADRPIVVPITGVKTETASENYAGQSISWISLAADTLHWIPLTNVVGDATLTSSSH
ncbi:MAG: hypothetical protein U0350_10020 [Caldilineaceae bacterium]